MPTRAELETYRDQPVDDLIGPGLKLLFVGINPGLWTAATQTHFCHPSNRFYPALKRAGIIEWDVDTETGLTQEQRDSLVKAGIGITNFVNRATVRADELDASELRAGATRLVGVVEKHRPRVVAIAGITAYRTAFDRPKAVVGDQGELLGPARLWVIPNPSGLNAHVTPDSMAEWMKRVFHCTTAPIG